MPGGHGLPPSACWPRFPVPTFPPVRCPLGLWGSSWHRTSCQFLGWPWWTWGKVLAQSVARYWYTLQVLPKSEERSINMPAGMRPWRDMGQGQSRAEWPREGGASGIPRGHNGRSRLLRRGGRGGAAGLWKGTEGVVSSHSPPHASHQAMARSAPPHCLAPCWAPPGPQSNKTK